MNTQKLTATFPVKNLESLMKMRTNALEKIDAEGESLEIKSYILALDEEILRRIPLVEDGWTPGRQHEPRFFFSRGKNIGLVWRKVTHTYTNSDVYCAELFGKPVEGEFRHIDEARAAVEKAFASFRASQ